MWTCFRMSPRGALGRARGVALGAVLPLLLPCREGVVIEFFT